MCYREKGGNLRPDLLGLGKKIASNDEAALCLGERESDGSQLLADEGQTVDRGI